MRTWEVHLFLLFKKMKEETLARLAPQGRFFESITTAPHLPIHQLFARGWLLTAHRPMGTTSRLDLAKTVRFLGLGLCGHSQFHP